RMAGDRDLLAVVRDDGDLDAERAQRTRRPLRILAWEQPREDAGALGHRRQDQGTMRYRLVAGDPNLDQVGSRCGSPTHVRLTPAPSGTGPLSPSHRMRPPSWGRLRALHAPMGADRPRNVKICA